MADKRQLLQPPAVQLDVRRIALVGTVAWFVAFVALLPFYDWLGRNDHRIWLWTSLAGSLLGLAGYALASRHRRLGRTT